MLIAKIKNMTRKSAAERERRRADEQAQIEEKRRAEAERLMALSEKELLVEILLELKAANRTAAKGKNYGLVWEYHWNY